MVVRPDTGLGHARDDGRARGAADTGGHVRASEPRPSRGQGVDVRRLDHVVAVARHPVVRVLDVDPENVRSGRVGWQGVGGFLRLCR